MAGRRERVSNRQRMPNFPDPDPSLGSKSEHSRSSRPPPWDAGRDQMLNEHPRLMMPLLMRSRKGKNGGGGPEACDNDGLRPCRDIAFLQAAVLVLGYFWSRQSVRDTWGFE